MVFTSSLFDAQIQSVKKYENVKKSAEYESEGKKPASLLVTSLNKASNEVP